MNLDKFSTGYTGAFTAGLIFAIFLTIILSVFIGLLFYLTPLSETFLPLTSSIILVISVFMGSLTTARRVGTKGLLLGILIAIVYLVLVAVMAFMMEIQVTSASVGFSNKVLLAVISGGLGGIVGVGLNRD